MEITLQHYQGTPLEKGFNELNTLAEDIQEINRMEKSLKDNLNKGYIDKTLFDKGIHTLDIMKAGKLSNNGKLKPVHIIDKNGNHRVVWK